MYYDNVTLEWLTKVSNGLTAIKYHEGYEIGKVPIQDIGTGEVAGYFEEIDSTWVFVPLDNPPADGVE